MKKQLISILLAGVLGLGTAPPAFAAQTADVISTDAIAARRADLATLSTTLALVHPNIYANTPKSVFDAKRAEIENRLPELSNFDFAIALSEYVALVGDSHTGAHIGNLAGSLHFLPFAPSYYNGEWILSALSAEHRDCLGGALLAINDIPISEVQSRISAMIGADNEVYARRQLGSLLYVYEVLHYYGIANSPEEITLTVRLQDNTTQHISMPARLSAEIQQLPTVSLNEQVTALAPTAADRSKLYFMKPLDDRTIYIQYNACQEDESLPMETFAGQIETAIRQNGYNRAIVDLRNNGGGSDGVFIPLLHLLEEKHEQDGMAFYTLIGEATFSSALINAVELKNAGATLVGTPTGGSVDHFGAVSSFTLPNTGIVIGHSTKFIDLGELLPAAQAYGVESLPPDISVTQTLEDSLTGNDTAVNIILSRTNDVTQPQPSLTRAALATALGRAYAAETGSQIALGQSPFPDVSMFTYSAPYIIWAQQNNIMCGESTGYFAPNRAVTRQELACVLARYLTFRGKGLASQPASLLDAASISPWAADSVHAMAGAGILPLINGSFLPNYAVSRAEWAEILPKLSF